METLNPGSQAQASARPHADREGFALVAALLVVLVLSVLAVGAAWLATSEKKTTVAESTHLRSVYSADAGSEAGINFIRTQDRPLLSTYQGAETALAGSQTYSQSTQVTGRRTPPGWTGQYQDFDYSVTSTGEAGAQGRAGVSLVVSRLYKTGY